MSLAGAGMDKHTYTGLGGDAAEQDLAAKIERLRSLPALIRAAEREERQHISLEKDIEMFEECERLHIGVPSS